jgi:hypothetical protein
MGSASCQAFAGLGGVGMEKLPSASGGRLSRGGHLLRLHDPACCSNPPPRIAVGPLDNNGAKLNPTAA